MQATRARTGAAFPALCAAVEAHRSTRRLARCRAEAQTHKCPEPRALAPTFSRISMNSSSLSRVD